MELLKLADSSQAHSGGGGGGVVPKDKAASTRGAALNWVVQLFSQRPLETCLKFRCFAARNLRHRAGLLRGFHARLELWRTCRTAYEDRLCGGLREGSPPLRALAYR